MTLLGEIEFSKFIALLSRAPAHCARVVVLARGQDKRQQMSTGPVGTLFIIPFD